MSNGREALIGGGGGSIAVAIDGDKATYHALKWAIDNFVSRDQIVKLVHVLQRPPSAPPYPADRSNSSLEIRQLDGPTKLMVLRFQFYCLRREVKYEVVLIEDLDVARGLVDFITHYTVENFFLGAASKTFFRLFKNVDTPSTVMKSAPDFCNVYVIGNGNVMSVRAALRPVPTAIIERARLDRVAGQLRGGNMNERAYDEISTSENEDSCEAPGRLSTDSNFLSFYEDLRPPLQDDSYMNSGFEQQSDYNLDLFKGAKPQVDLDLHNELLATPQDQDTSDGKVPQTSNTGLTDEDA